MAGAESSQPRQGLVGPRSFQSQQVVDQQQSVAAIGARAGIAKTQAQIAQKLIRAPFAGQLGVRQAEVGGFI